MNKTQLTSDHVFEELQDAADPQRAATASWFFKTGKGQYGYGDKFLGLSVPAQRKVAARYHTLPLDQTIQLLRSPWHEARLTALFILVKQFQRGDSIQQKAIFETYIANRAYVNNWDLVDSSADKIVGAWLADKSNQLLYDLAASSTLWDRRIAIISTYAYIRNGQPEQTLHIAKKLLHDNEDLIHKAVGWMLREIGKRCDRSILEDFLRPRYKSMPRTMLRYAIEHFPPDRRQQYLKGLI